jgi:F-type H+-transporting ATPase subunit b
MLHTVLIFGDSSSGLGALGVNGSDFIIQLITFVLAYFVLRRYAFGPIIKALNERREKIETGVALTEQMQREKAELDKKVAAALHDARKQADGILADAQEAAREAIRQAEDKAREKADSIIDDAQTRTHQDEARMRKALEKEIVGLIADAAGVIIDEKVDATKDAALIERAIREQQTA